jgi:hypothetical protein
MQNLVAVSMTLRVVLTNLPLGAARSTAFPLFVVGDAGAVAGAGCLSTPAVQALVG